MHCGSKVCDFYSKLLVLLLTCFRRMKLYGLSAGLLKRTVTAVTNTSLSATVSHSVCSNVPVPRED
jgi:hypothetical protein